MQLTPAGEPITLAKAGGRVDEVIVLRDGTHVVRNSDFENAEDQSLELYDRSGRLIRRLAGYGRSPGSFYRLKDVAVTAGTTIWAADIIGRLSFLDLRGKLLGTKLIQNPGYQVDGLAIDEGRGFFFLSGCLPTAGFLDRGCVLVHQYRIRDKAHARSFLPTDPDVLTKNHVALQDVAIALDGMGRVFAADAPVLKLNRVDPRSGATRTFPLRSRTLRPLPTLDKTSEAALRAYESSDLIERIVVAEGYAVVSVRRPAKRGFLLAVFTLDGVQVGVDLPSPGELVGKTAEGKLLFARRVGTGHEITKYGLATRADPKGAR
ncbi:MAG TPA: hypothetical protein VF121_00585 [Thermoanaerobaculia bacterium]|nr:hypothetical protein [Thermoanaerobaculia bacterium]